MSKIDDKNEIYFEKCKGKVVQSIDGYGGELNIIFTDNSRLNIEIDSEWDWDNHESHFLDVVLRETNLIKQAQEK